MGQNQNMQDSIILSPVGTAGKYANPKKSKKKNIIITAIVAIVIALIVVLIISISNKIRRDQGENIYNASQDYVATLYNDIAASEYLELAQNSPDSIKNQQDWLIVKLMDDTINNNIEKKRSIAAKIVASFDKINAAYNDYAYKNERTDEIIKNNNSIKDALILHLTVGKKDTEIYSYITDKEIDNDINLLQEKVNNSSLNTKAYYSVLLNFRMSQKKYLNYLLKKGCLKKSGVDVECVAYMPKSDTYGSISAKYNTDLIKIRQESTNLARAAIMSSRLLNGIGL